MATLRGTIGPNGYVPPANVTVTWRRPGAPDLPKKLRPSVPFTGPGNASVYSRYGEDDPDCTGRQITAIGSEQLGGRAWLILKELYAQAGLTRVPPQIGQEVWDFAVAECPDRPADWCDYKRFTGKPDPICGENCPPCAGGGSIPAGSVSPAPTNLRLENRVLSWDWTGNPKPRPSFDAYRKDGERFIALGRSTGSPMTLRERPADGTLVLLYVGQRKHQKGEAQLLVGGAPVEPVEPPPVEPPPVEPPPPPAPVIRLRPSSFEVVVDGKVLGTVRLDFIPAAPSAPSTPAAPKPGGPGR